MIRTSFAARSLVAALCLLLAVAATAKSPTFAGPPLPHFVDEASLPFDALAGTDTERFFGVHKGAAYRVEVPADWNGDLVMFAHGFRGNCAADGSGSCELTVDNPPIRRLLVEQGFAWAASSYSVNGYQIPAGVKDTHALATRFNGLVGKPRRVYLVGFSMGGHITGVSIEQYGNFYDGALPMCGVMGDNELFDYFLDTNMVAVTLTGQEGRIDFPLPEDFEYFGDLVPDIKSAFGPGFPLFPNATGQAWKDATENLSGGERPLYDQGFVFWNVFAADFLFTLFGGDDSLGAAPGSVTSNIDAIYQIDQDFGALSFLEADVNARAPRKDADPQGRHPNGLSAIPVIAGNFSIPVLSLHTLGDLFVPFSMQQVYARRAIANGSDHLLVQRAIRDAQHCGFSITEMETAFTDLVDWVETGTRPQGDDVLDRDVVRGADYGCRFTEPVKGPGRPSAFFDALPPPFPGLPDCP